MEYKISSNVEVPKSINSNEGNKIDDLISRKEKHNDSDIETIIRQWFICLIDDEIAKMQKSISKEWLAFIETDKEAEKERYSIEVTRLEKYVDFLEEIKEKYSKNRKDK